MTSLYRALITNHPLANITFVVVLLLGALAYLTMPREQDPEINFNFVIITTVLPGASAEDVERKITEPLEDALRNVQDVRFVSSASRENVSIITVRFWEVSDRLFDKRVNDLRARIQAKANSELPRDIVEPEILEITTSNGFPTAMLALHGQARDEVLRREAFTVRRDLERIAGVDQVIAIGLAEPEIHIEFDPAALAGRGLVATDLADQVRGWFQDVFAGRAKIGQSEWTVRLIGQGEAPEFLASLPIRSRAQVQGTALEELARIERGRERMAMMSSFNGRPAVLLSVNKRSRTNTPALVERLRDYAQARSAELASRGLKLELADDQTVPTKAALDVMESNALIGLLLVFAVCWVFLGTGISLLVAAGVMFSIAGTLWVLQLMGSSLNVQVFVGLVIVLGMLVDDAIVIVEDIYYRIERGAEPVIAALAAVQCVGAPVVASVLTTMAAFLPLVLLPGIVGQFLKVIPIVVTLGLAISLIEAFWMVPAHVIDLKRWRRRSDGLRRPDWRWKMTQWLRLRYTRGLLQVMRRPWIGALLLLLAVGGALTALQSGRVKFEFFAFDPFRLFYINVDMPGGSSVEATLAETERIAEAVRGMIDPQTVRAISVQAGFKYTDTEPLYGEQFGQIQVSLLPRSGEQLRTDELVNQLRERVLALPRAAAISFFITSGGPPKGTPIAIKLLASDLSTLNRAVAALKKEIADHVPGAIDIADDRIPGRPQLILRPNRAALDAAGIDAGQFARLLRLHLDGEIASTELRDRGEQVEIRVRAARAAQLDVRAVLDDPIALPDGRSSTLGAFVEVAEGTGEGVIRHYKFKRSISVTANLEPGSTDSLRANQIALARWAEIADQYPETTVDTSGEFDDINESLGAMGGLFLLGIGLIYLIMAAQFRSYFLPFLLLVTVPFAFCGVVIGLSLYSYPISLYTLYGTIALTGIAVNAGIVYADAARERLKAGMSVLHATVYAARRRVVPIIMTTTTTMGGLATLAFGVGGTSLLWGPVASAVFFGLMVSTTLTLFLLPPLFRYAMLLSELLNRLATLRGDARNGPRAHVEDH